MLNLLFICLSTCISINYPLESSFILFILIIVIFNTNSIIYYNSIIDSLNCNLVLLSYFVILLCIMTNSTMSQTNNYLLCNSILLLLLISSFFSNSLLTFFILFEASLIPLFILILGWGYQPERLQSSIYFLFYTLFGSLPLLVTLIFFSQLNITSWVNKIINLDLVIYCCLIFAFLVNMPMFLVHLWLPNAHVEAPTIGSMILAGITLKLGSYALLRLLSITENFTLKFNWIWISISAIGNLLLCFVCLRQIDLNSLIAYSSVIHMGLCLLTILFLLNWSFEGGLWLSLSHGLASSGLFFLTNSTYLRFNSRSLYINNGLAFTLPLISLWLFILLIFNMASPPSLNLFSEINMVATTVSISWFLLIISAISSFFCAAYCLFLFNNLFHGNHNNTQNFSNTIIINEHLVLFYHLWPLIISALILYFIQWNN